MLSTLGTLKIGFAPKGRLALAVSYSSSYTGLTI
jgi:hypothetical protein